MRAILDTNTLISMAITPTKSSTTMWRLFQHARDGVFRPILLEHVIDEFYQAIGRKPYLLRTVSRTWADQFIGDLRCFSEIVPNLEIPTSLQSRDADDDVLIAYALMLDVDFLVTGDRDLLVLQRALTMIVSPAEFLALIELKTEEPD